jgi:hypothetical protein
MKIQTKSSIPEQSLTGKNSLVRQGSVEGKDDFMRCHIDEIVAAGESTEGKRKFYAIVWGVAIALACASTYLTAKYTSDMTADAVIRKQKQQQKIDAKTNPPLSRMA